jgi:hypothetical protein
VYNRLEGNALETIDAILETHEDQKTLVSDWSIRNNRHYI